MAAMQPIEEVGEEEEEEEVIGQVSHTVNEYITLFQPDLCVIYAWAHWTSKSEDDQGSCIEIKQIVGHALLQLDDDMYDRLDLKDVIDRFHDQNNGLTSAVRVAAERHKNRWVDWIPQLREKYLGMCRKDKKLAKQGKDELTAHRAEGAASLTHREERRLQEDKTHPSIAAVLAGSSSASQGGRGRSETK